MTNYMSEFGPIKMNFKPSKYRTATGAAKAFHKALLKIVEETGANPKYCYLWSPEEASSRGYGNAWMVCWEEGCFEWAVGTSMECSAETWHTEPYYSFNLSFYDNY